MCACAWGGGAQRAQLHNAAVCLSTLLAFTKYQLDQLDSFAAHDPRGGCMAANKCSRRAMVLASRCHCGGTAEQRAWSDSTCKGRALAHAAEEGRGGVSHIARPAPWSGSWQACPRAGMARKCVHGHGHAHASCPCPCAWPGRKSNTCDAQHQLSMAGGEPRPEKGRLPLHAWMDAYMLGRMQTCTAQRLCKLRCHHGPPTAHHSTRHGGHHTTNIYRRPPHAVNAARTAHIHNVTEGCGDKTTHNIQTD